MEKQQRKKVKELEKLDKVKIGYARVSSQDDRQKLGLEVQTEALKNCDIIFSEKQSGDNDNRPELTNAILLAKQLSRQNKLVTLQTYKLDRLTRKMLTLANIIDDFNTHGIKLNSILENIETDSLTGRLLCLVLGYVAEIELDNIRIRTKDGLRKAKENGVILGNPSLTEKQELEILKQYQMNTIPISLIAKRLHISESSVYKVARKYGVSRRKNLKIPVKV
ncbi:recombinase family protein [Enterococcus faecalis]|uniref:Recombinase family protein n=1 Tax=Enterococcus faecalis TaxID=1351 RepID=A0AAP6RHR4_ENTFL|nr:recombinase family protein [Enterococcus faecalis]MXS29377.1 recombinase family protein [Enterococcus faecalis]MXS52586.1 recombinase family protein [Enterococcus faecalis]